MKIATQRHDDDQLLDDSWLAKYLKFERKTAQAWRTRGGGPPFIKVGRLIRYRKADVDAWIESRRVSSTSDSVR
ncbi:MAG: helix-turn-helix domain-containing protein [Nitrospira defluvii]|nr:helix-turn-helix domain-containing protein [Nitrospira defluvii]